MATAILFLGDKGGIGKDVLCEGTAHAALMRGLSPVLIEIESSRRLGLLYPDAKSIVLDAPSPQSVYDNPDRIFEPLDAASEIWRTAEFSVTSFGANVTSAFLAWGRAHGAHALNDGANVTAAVVLTMNRHALASGLQNLFDLGLVLPLARRVAILNDLHANFVEGDQYLARRLEEARGAGAPIETIGIRRCSAPVWGYAQNMGSLKEIAELDPQRLIDLGLPQGPVYRSKSIIATWIADGLVAPLSALLPTGEKPRKARASK